MLDVVGWKKLRCAEDGYDDIFHLCLALKNFASASTHFMMNKMLIITIFTKIEWASWFWCVIFSEITTQNLCEVGWKYHLPQCPTPFFLVMTELSCGTSLSVRTRTKNFLDNNFVFSKFVSLHSPTLHCIWDLMNGVTAELLNLSRQSVKGTIL